MRTLEGLSRVAIMHTLFLGGGGLWIRNFLALEKATAVRKPPAEETDFQL